MHSPVKMLRFAVNFVRLVRDPNRVDLVLKIADGTADPEAMRTILARPAVAEFLARRPPPLRVSLPALRALPAGSLGRAFAAFLDDRGFDPTGLYHSGEADADDIDRFKVHMQRTHDLWHTVVGFGTDVAGELGLQAFTMAQLGTPLGYVILAAGMLGTLFFERDDGDRRMEAITRGWQLGRRARPLFGADWDAMFTWPIEQVRAHFGLEGADIRATSLAA
jgi:ubiquinone biosynthesis protein COQ4